MVLTVSRSRFADHETWRIRHPGRRNAAECRDRPDGAASTRSRAQKLQTREQSSLSWSQRRQGTTWRCIDFDGPGVAPRRVLSRTEPSRTENGTRETTTRPAVSRELLPERPGSNTRTGEGGPGSAVHGRALRMPMNTPGRGPAGLEPIFLARGRRRRVRSGSGRVAAEDEGRRSVPPEE